MKHRLLLLSLFLSILSLGAQTPSNRTNKTIIVDALAQLPAKNPKVAQNIFKEIASTGTEGVQQITQMYGTDNSKVEYALNGLTDYVATFGNADQKKDLSETYSRSLNQAKDVELKRFLISQLKIVGEDKAVSALASLLTDSDLCAPASQALASMNSTASIDALISASKQENACTTNIINALGNITNSFSVELALLDLYKTTSTTNKDQIISVLSRIGRDKSLSIIEKSGSEITLIGLINSMIEYGQISEATKALSKLEKKTKNSKNIALLVDIFSASYQLNPSKREVLIRQAMSNPSQQYRNGILHILITDPSTPLVNVLIQLAKSSEDEQKTEILNAIMLMSRNPKNIQFIDVSATTSLLNYAENTNLSVATPAIRTLIHTKEESVIPVLVNLLKSDDVAVLSLAQQSLEGVDGNINQPVINAIPDASEGGKVVGLELLSTRKANDGLNIIIRETQNSNSKTSNAAYKALVGVSENKDLPTLFDLLDASQNPNTPFIQQAILVALKDQEVDKQVNLVLAQMKKVSADKQSLYYSILAGIPSATALNTLKAVFEANDKNSGKALEAMLQWQNTDILSYLYKLCLDNKSAASFDAILNRYIQLSTSKNLTGENSRIYLENALVIAKTTEQENEILQGLGNTNSYVALLLAGNYLDKTSCQQNAANTVMKLALGNLNFTGQQVNSLLNKVIQVLDNPDAGYQKEAIKKHLAQISGQPAYNSMFDGKTLAGWKGLVADPIKRAKMSATTLKAEQVKADNEMAKNWKVEDGMIVYYGTGYDNLCTDKQYGDFEMLVDWQLDPNGHEPDAGIYLRGTPQVQIWDIARTNVGAEVGSGGLYNNTTHESKPLVVADNELGEWNNLYIKMIGDRVTVMLNSVLVVDNITLENYWNRSLPIFVKEQIELQAHGSRVFYRNLYIKELPTVEPYVLSDEEKQEGYKILFDGTNMHEWIGNTIDYIIEDGTISMHPTSRYGGNLFTKDEYGDFIYRFEFQMTPGANNGVGIRSPLEGDAAYEGIEIQILDHDDPIYNDITPLQVHGSVYGIIGADRVRQKPMGEWNYEEIRAIGDHITVILNGKVILDGNIRDATKNGTPDKKEHPGLFNEKGHIGFLGHGSPIKFKNIRIKEIR